MKVDKDSDEVCVPLPGDGFRLTRGKKPVFRARLNATDPVLFYSGAEGACVDRLMMGVINPVSEDRKGELD